MPIFRCSVDYAQEYLYVFWNRFQPTGTCCLIPMKAFPNPFECKYVAHCPTMRTPSNCIWNKEVVYNCFWSLLNEIRIHNVSKPQDKIKSVFVTGLGTGIGRFLSDVCAKQMILAYSHFVRNLVKEQKSSSWSEIRNDGLDIEETHRTRSILN